MTNTIDGNERMHARACMRVRAGVFTCARCGLTADSDGGRTVAAHVGACAQQRSAA